MPTDAVKPANTQKRPKAGRSPAYPSVSLKTAIEKAAAQLEQEGKYAIPMPSAFTAWGYGEKSSGGRDVRASMRYFGLISIEGEGDGAKVKLTDDALRVLLDERPDQTEKKAIMKRLALNPSAHKKLWSKFTDGIKSDATAAHYLIFEEGFNKAAADALIAEFKETAAYAGIYEPDSIPVILNPDGGEDDHDEDETPEPETPAGRNPSTPKGKVALMDTERVAFIEESQPGQYLKLIASGDVDDTMLEALEDYVKRQRKRLAATFGDILSRQVGSAPKPAEDADE
jgi:hypothetical protein